MNTLTAISPPFAHQRAHGLLTLGVDSPALGKSRLKTVRQEGSYRMLFPRARPGGVDAVILNTSGGVTGGDRFEVGADVEAGAHLTLTTQAAERIYRATDGQTGRLQTALTVAANASLFWMPQETILFDGCALRRKLLATLEKTSHFLMVEPVIFGRSASGEVIENGAFHDRVEIIRDGQTVYRDGVSLTGNIAQTLTRTAVAGGARAMASVVLHHKDAATRLPTLRDMLPNTGGASLPADDLLVVRVLAEDGYALRQSLVPVLTYLTDDAMPKNWKL